MSEVTRLPKRSEVPLELTWDLTKIFATDAEFEEAFGQVVKAAEDFEQYKGTLENGAQAFLAALTAMLKLDRQLEVVYVYASMKNDEDTANEIGRAHV